MGLADDFHKRMQKKGQLEGSSEEVIRKEPVFETITESIPLRTKEEEGPVIEAPVEASKKTDKMSFNWTKKEGVEENDSEGVVKEEVVVTEEVDPEVLQRMSEADRMVISKNKRVASISISKDMFK